MYGFYGTGHNLFMQGGFGCIGIVFIILHILFWIAAICFAVKLYHKYFKRVGESKTKNNTAMAILRERYAKGEIDSEEFNKRKSDLE
ncbi:SHOCT domain-containing protein [Parasporobacterium paucivorans]|uniref:Putative membrane protein n=1 Tax=Parasporobacterium paucivorans DSM 15970 TaxID=1122934 RepID=A0A1M6HY25_9FIRM|nr:SHOCT domain-containing protein [Parasporobacterium paucivorans]SHJ27105.1 putative membrane protein [Parasporobacterium paucivorans DSM 15970]